MKSNPCPLIACMLAICSAAFSACVSGGDDGTGGIGSLGTGGHDASGTSPPALPAGCKLITVAPFAPGQVPGWLEAHAVGDGLHDATLRIELDARPAAPVEAGAFDLSKSPDNDYATCAHCAVLFDEGDDPVDAARVFFQVSGLLQLDQVPSPVSSETKAAAANLAVVEVTVDPDSFHTSPVAGGDCYAVASLSVDTTVPMGTSCTGAEQCGDTSSKICDPATATCAAAQCGQGLPDCPSGTTCLAQTQDAVGGACYTSCIPFGADSCGVGEECVVTRLDQSEGVCVRRGSVSEGQPCNGGLATTGCATGLRCAAEYSGNVCRRTCDYFAPAPACPDAQACVIGSFCTDGAIDPAPPDQYCDSAAPEGSPCGYDGQASRGICVAESGAAGEVVMCRRACRTSSPTDCSSGQTCHDYYGSVGVCQ